ncbi:AI-2E family transporter [Muricauda sp. HICW]|uniref:AI-2E family transporter n=1 Tax=Flagellimonas chongwuensis TaxID=2697365 RepID=A0A850NM66_9FLAO|nr:AI-2E family transporter [Allomuricauda chongwuensis]NVN19368.1 AI-2E family transporter [Allomuricauda chongwuensis]
MNSKTIANGILRAVAIMVGAVLICWFFYKIQSVLAYLAIAAVIALLGRPVVRFLRDRLKFPNTFAVVITMIFMLFLFLGILALFIPLVAEQSKNLSLLDMETLKNDLNSLYLQTLDYFGASTRSVNNMLDESKIEENVLKGLDLKFIPNFINSIVNVLSNFSIGLFSVLFISFFFLKDSKLMQNGILTFVPDDKESNLVKSVDKINNLLSRYFAGILLQLFILFVIYTISLLIVGVENAIVIAFLCALFNIIPYIGPIIGGVTMVLLTMTTFIDADFSTVILPKAMYVLIGLTVGQLIDNFFSQPFIFSTSVKSHPLEIFLIIIIAGLLFGVVGMVVAVPGYTAIKVILKEFLAENSFVKKLTKNL